MRKRIELLSFVLLGYGFTLAFRNYESTYSIFEYNNPFYSYRKFFKIPIPSNDNDITIRAKIKTKGLLLRIRLDN